MAIDYMDLANRYASARLDQATRPFTDTEGYLNDRIKQNYGVDIYGNTKPKSMTITNNDDGSQTVTQKTEVAPQQDQGQPAYMPDENQAETQRLLAQNAAAAPQPAPMPAAVPTPVAQPNQMQARSLAPAPQPAAVPTPVAQPNPVQGTALPPMAPVAPEPMPDQTQAETNRLQAQAAAAAPVAPTPISTVGQAAVDQVNATQLPSASRGVQVAGGAPGAGLAPATIAPNPNEQHQQAIIAAHNEQDPVRRRQMLGQLLGTEGVSKENQMMANEILARDYLDQKKTAEAEKKVANLKDTDIARYMKDKSVEGSYVKAILFARLGLNDLARQEQERINPSVAMGSEVGADGQRYSVVRNRDGFITKAFDSSGVEADDKKVAELSATSMATKGNVGQAGATRVRDSKGNEWSVVPTTRGSQFFDNTGKQGVPEGKTVPIAVSGDVGLQRELAISRAQIALSGKKGSEAISVIGDLNKKLQAEGLPTVSYDDVGMNDKGEFVTSRTGTAPAGGTTTTAGVPKFKDASIEIISARRGNAEQQAMYDAAKPDLSKDPSGQTRYNSAGNPVAQPGSSAHEGPEGNALDVNAKKLTRAGRAELAAQGYYQPIPQKDPNHWERLPGAAPAGAPAGGVADVTRQRESAAALGKEERSNFLTYEEKDIVPKADAASNISRVRKQQLKGPDGILNNPEIVGILSGQGGKGTEFANLIRDMITGGVSNDELSRRVNALGLDQRQRDLVYNQLQLNNTIAPETLKANAGPGSVSDAEQRANKQALVDITRVPLYTAATMMTRDQFEKDVTVARQAFRTANPNIGTVREFNDAWGKEKERLQGEYDRIYDARAKYIAKYYNDGKNPLAITEAYKNFPVPEFSRDGGWNYGTDYARKAARKPLDSFNR